VTGARALIAGGPVRVRSGLDGTLLRVLGSGDGFGVSFSQVPDLNGDQFPELIVGLPLHDLPNLADVGKAEVLSIGGARRYGNDPSQEMRLASQPQHRRDLEVREPLLGRQRRLPVQGEPDQSRVVRDEGAEDGRADRRERA